MSKEELYDVVLVISQYLAVRMLLYRAKTQKAYTHRRGPKKAF